MGPQFFALVLHDTIIMIPENLLCEALQSTLWYLDDGVLSGPRAALSRAIEIIQGECIINAWATH